MIPANRDWRMASTAGWKAENNHSGRENVSLHVSLKIYNHANLLVIKRLCGELRCPGQTQSPENLEILGAFSLCCRKTVWSFQITGWSSCQQTLEVQAAYFLRKMPGSSSRRLSFHHRNANPHYADSATPTAPRGVENKSVPFSLCDDGISVDPGCNCSASGQVGQTDHCDLEVRVIAAAADRLQHSAIYLFASHESSGCWIRVGLSSAEGCSYLMTTAPASTSTHQR